MVKRYHECAKCRSSAVGLAQQRHYTLRTVPIGAKPVFLLVALSTLMCWNCGAGQQEAGDIADPKKSYTRAFARLLIELSTKMTMLDIALRLGVGWELVKGIIEERLQHRAKRRSWRGVRRMAIDEIAVREGQNYMTIVVDLDSGRVLCFAEGDAHSALEAFFRKLRRSRARLEAIAVDMSGGYLKAVKLCTPKGVLVVHDRYHVVAEMNRVMDSVRRDEQNRLDAEARKVSKGSRYLLLYGKEKLDELPRKKARLDALLEANEFLHEVYRLKEDLRLFWSQESRKKADDFIHSWFSEASGLGNAHVTRMANTIERRMAAILAWYDQPITTGPLEGLNNKIKVLKRSAYGYRDQAFFGLRILFLHETQFKLAGA